MAAILAVTGVGPATNGGPAEGVMAALKLSRPDDPLSVEALEREIAVFDALCTSPGEPPCPRLFDVILSPSPGLVMEWCPLDLERWWEARHGRPEAMPELFEALASVCRRVREYAVVSEIELGRRVVHADIKPRNVLLNASGRWLLTDFGAAKSRSVEEEGWEATRMIIGTENYIAPETLFNARKSHPAAMDTWSIGCTLFALLRMRTLLRGGGRMPANGTHGFHFRTHRAGLVNDLQLRRPTLFADRDLDTSAFLSPDRLPDKDRSAIAESLGGLYANPHLEARLVADVTNLLDRALQIDPARRYTDPIEMAGDLEALASRARELAVRADGGPTGPRGSTPAVGPPAPKGSAPRSVRRRLSRLWLLGGGVVALGGVGLLLLVGVGAVWWALRRPPSDLAPAAVVAPAPLPLPPSAPAVPLDPPVKSNAEAPDLSARAPRGSGVLLVVGGEAYVVGPKGRRGTGTLPEGSYELFARVDGAFVSQGSTEVVEGETTTWHCGFGTCREDE